MELSFEGAGEFFRYKINRRKKTLIIQSVQTNYQWQRMPWLYLFDKGKERFQDMQTRKLNDEQFKQVIILEMANSGYKPI